MSYVLDDTDTLCGLAELIPDRLYLSGCPETPYGPSRARIREAGIDAIVDLYGAGDVTPQETRGLLYLAWFFYDHENGLPDLDTLSTVVELIATLIASKKRVLVHCQAGINRSSLVAALVLRRVTGISGTEAIALIRAKRHPQALINPVFARYVDSKP